MKIYTTIYVIIYVIVYDAIFHEMILIEHKSTFEEITNYLIRVIILILKNNINHHHIGR